MSAPNNNVEFLELTSDSLAAQQSHRLLLLDIEARKRASTVDVPTLPNDVRDTLRIWGEPIRLFGEDLAAIRDRLRMVMARWEVWKEQQEKGLVDSQMQLPPPMMGEEGAGLGAAVEEEITETTYTHASSELIHARKYMCDYSLGRSRHRLEMERQRRKGMVRWTRSKKRARLFDKEDEDGDDHGGSSLYTNATLKEESNLVKELDNNCEKIYKSIRNQALEGSQYGDVRPLSAVCTSSVQSVVGSDVPSGSFPKIIATGGWSGGIKIWNGGDDHNGNNTRSDNYLQEAAPLDMLGAKNIVHEDRIMGIAMKPYITSMTSTEPLTLVASASIDLTAKLCAVKLNEDANISDAMDVENLNTKDNQLHYNIEECAYLKGHAARLSNVVRGSMLQLPALITPGVYGMLKPRPWKRGKSYCCKMGMLVRFMVWASIPMDHWWPQQTLGEWCNAGIYERASLRVISWGMPNASFVQSLVLMDSSWQLLVMMVLSRSGIYVVGAHRHLSRRTPISSLS